MKRVFNSFLLVVCMLFASISFADQVNINSASAEAIAQGVKGIGLKKAQAIVAYRKQHGPFKRIEDLAQVKGIGKKTVDANKHLLVLHGSKTTKKQRR